MIKDTKTDRKLTPKQYLKLHPEKYVLAANLSKNPKEPLMVYVSEAPEGSSLFAVGLTYDKNKAIIWGSLDNTPTKLQWHQVKTGLKNLEWQQVSQE